MLFQEILVRLSILRSVVPPFLLSFETLDLLAEI